MHVEDNIPAAKKEPWRTASGAKVMRRFDDFEALIVTVESELADDHYSTGLGKFVEAVNLSRGFPVLEERALEFAVEQATQLLPRTWRVARSLLLETANVSAKRATPRELWEGIQQQEREEAIRSALKAADMASTNGMAPLARQRLATLQTKYPDDPRIAPRLKTIEAQCLSKLEVERRRQADKEAEAAKASQLLAQATWAKAREFERTGFYDEALEYWEALRKIDPQYPGLQTEISRCTALKNAPPLAQPEQPPLPLAARPADKREQPPLAPVQKQRRELRPPAVAAPNQLWRTLTVIFAGLTIATLGVSVWTYSSRFSTRPVATPSVAKPKGPRVPVVSLEARTPPAPPLLSPAPSEYTSVVVPVPSEIARPRHPAAATVTVVESPALSTPVPAGNTNQEISDSSRSIVVVEQPRRPAIANQTAPEIQPPPPAMPTAPDLINFAATQQLAELDTRTKANNEVLALDAIRRAEAAQQRQSAEVLAVVRQYAAAWSARNVDSILSIQRNLDRRTLKAQLSPIKSLAMSLSPSANPLIEGERATVLCRRQVSEVFEDGVAKQTPEQTVTFILAKRDGTWTIESTMQ